MFSPSLDLLMTNKTTDESSQPLMYDVYPFSWALDILKDGLDDPISLFRYNYPY